MEQRAKMTVDQVFGDPLERDLALRTISFHLNTSGLYNNAQIRYILGRNLNSVLTMFKWSEYCAARSLLTEAATLEAYIKLKYALPTYLNNNSAKPPISIRNSVVLP